MSMNADTMEAQLSKESSGGIQKSTDELDYAECNEIDFTRPVTIAPDIFWVGIYLENDPFQCHPYLIRNGNESILIDPGSMIQIDA
ncbi:MAG: hypothetical protein KDK34_02705, partial [Leptospiraceae bacterium]|nr:hypothetical protein [Leptospiraceae bacterium]